MPRPDPRPVRTADGEPLHALVTRRAPELARRATAVLVETVPFYRLLPREAVEGEITAIVETNTRMMAEALRTGAPVPAERLEAIGRSAARRAEEGVPLEEVLRAYHVGMRFIWEEVRGDLADLEDVRTVVGVLLEFLSTLSAVIVADYVREREAMAASRQGAQHRLVTALLSGESAEQTAISTGLPLAAGYEVLALGFHPDPEDAAGNATLGHGQRAPGGQGVADADVRTAIVSRRRIRALTSALDRHTAGTKLHLLDGFGGLVLIPGAQNTATLERLHRDLTVAAGLGLTVAATVAATAEVPSATRLAREVLRIVRLTGRPPGVYRLEDVVLEYQLAQPTEANHRLAALLDPIAAHGELLLTLRLHLANELNRRHTAADLHVHPNTVDYRLRRIARLTGLDPAVPSAQRQLDAALTARLLSTPPVVVNGRPVPPMPR